MTRHPSEASPLLRGVPPRQSQSSLPNQPMTIKQHPSVQLRRKALRILTALLVVVIVCNLDDTRPVRLSVINAQTRGPVAAPAAQNLTLRLFSLNTFVRPVLIGINDFKDERLRDLLPVLNGFDVVCLQELFWATGPRKQRFLDALAREHGLVHYASAPAPSWGAFFSLPPKLIDAGLVIASRRPILHADFRMYSDASWQSLDYIVGKGVLYARIRLSESPVRFVHVFTMHLQASNGLDVPFDETRRKQLREIVDFVREKIADDPLGVVLLCGDFNVNARSGFNDSSSSDEYVAATKILNAIRPQIGLKDLLYEANGGTHPVTTAGGLDGMTQKNKRLDYVFLSSGKAAWKNVSVSASAVPGSVRVDKLRVEDRPYRTISDHYAVLADIFVVER